MSARKITRWMGETLRRPVVLISLGLVLLAILIWFVGPAIMIGDFQPLGSTAVRLSCLLALALGWGVGILFFRAKRSSEDAALLAALRRQQEETDAAADRNDALLESEFDAFRDAAHTTLQLLRKGRGGLFANTRYALPWYLILGSDGAGKTGIVHNSGLTLPFEAETATGGNRVHFHITDQAVLVEFPGRYLQQADKQLAPLWLRMLDHLKKLRAKQPINGIIVATGAEELLSMSEEDCQAYGTTVRKRLDEIMARLRTVAPVYLSTTKLDLIVGFDEFFETLPADGRNAALGVPLSALRTLDGSSPKSSFRNLLASLVERFSQQQFVRLHEEPDDFRRRRIFEFPGQFALLQSRLEPFLQQLSASHRFGQAPNIRGLFFTSARQSGNFSDQFGQSLAIDFGQRSGNLALASDDGFRRVRPYFLHGLFQDVIIPEANLSGLTKPALLMTRLQEIGTKIVLFFVIFVLFSLWWLGFGEGRAYLARVGDNVTATSASIAMATPDGKIPDKFEPVLDVLDRLKILQDEEPRNATFGLYSTGSVRSDAHQAYEKALKNLLFPFVWGYLREGLGNTSTHAALRFQQLKLYLMLTGNRPVDRQTTATLGADFASTWLVDDRSPEVSRRVSAHFAELVAVSVNPPQADMVLVDKARSLISDYTIARLAYDIALSRPQVQQLGVWRPVDHMGLSGPQALSRLGGGSFWDGIPGIFTKAGLKDVMLGASRTVAHQIANDLWVMGTDTNPVQQERESLRIREGMLDLYRVDYVTQWDSLLSDISIGGSATAGDVSRSVAIISGNPSPVKELLTAIAAETDLEAASTTVLDAVPGAAQTQSIARSALSPRRVVNVAKAVSDHFEAFRIAVTAPEGQQSPVDALLAAMEPLYRQLNHVATGGDILELGVEPQTLLNQLTERNRTLPATVQPLFARILSQAAAVTGGSSRERLSEIWRTTVLPLCRATMQGRYPFVERSTNDASLEDFATLFGPQGAISSFRQNYLKPFIDTSARPWRWRTGQQVGLGYDKVVLAALEKADDIRNVYFGDEPKPGIKFTVKAGKLDMRARAVVLETGGATMLYNHGPIVDTPFQWPSENPAAGANMSMMPELEATRNTLSQQGAWAVFRLFSLGHIIEKDPTDKVTYRFSVGGRQVLLRVTAPPTRNPFARNMLADYACPQL